MLELYYADALNKRTMIGLAEDEGKTYDTLRKDWSRRLEWEPLIWKIEQSKEDVEGILYNLRMARARAVGLMRSASQDSVRVAAIGKLIDAISKEIELRQSLGFLPKMAERLQVEQEVRQYVGKLEVTEDEDDILCRAASILDKRLAEAKEKERTKGKPVKIH